MSRLFPSIRATAFAPVALAATLLLTGSPLGTGGGPAEAAFPGKNGLIVFASQRTTGPGVDNPTGDYEIFTMNPDGTNVKQLTNNTVFDGDPAWSPTGKQIAFATNRDGNTEVYTMAADGTGQTNRTKNPALDDGATWSPDGTKIAFATNRDGNPEVYVMNADGSSQTLNGGVGLR